MLCWFQVYSRVIQLYGYVYSFFFRFFSHIDYQNIEYCSPVLHSRSLLVIYLVYSSVCLYVRPKLLIYSFSPHFPFGNHKFVFDICDFVSVFQISSFISLKKLDSTDEYIIYLSFSDILLHSV